MASLIQLCARKGCNHPPLLGGLRWKYCRDCLAKMEKQQARITERDREING